MHRRSGGTIASDLKYKHREIEFQIAEQALAAATTQQLVIHCPFGQSNFFPAYIDAFTSWNVPGRVEIVKVNR